MISELFGLLSSFDVSGKGKNQKFSINLNKNRIRSISAFSSNSIFYFPTIVSDQTMPEEQAMVIRVIEKAYASFVVACISLMPFHRIKADDKASVEDYLSQFHQNIGMNQGSGPILNKVFGYVDGLDISESVRKMDGFEETQNFLQECWNRSRSANEDFIKIVSETVSLNDMFSIDPVDPKTRVLQEQFMEKQIELDTWGFLGEATDDLLDSDMDNLLDMSDEEIEKSVEERYQERKMDDYLSGDNEPIDEMQNKLKKIGQEAREISRDISNDMHNQSRDLNKIADDYHNHRTTAKNESMTEGTVKSAVDSIKFSLESVSENKILSCQSLTKLAALESKLNKLKNKYTKYLNRYKRKVKENKEKGERKSLTIRFNGFQISNPKAFMKQYGTYIKIINKRLKLIEKRRAELRKRKGLPEPQKLEESALTDLTQLDFDALDYCIKTIDECLNAPDSEIFTISEASNKNQLRMPQTEEEYQKDIQDAEKRARLKAEAEARKHMKAQRDKLDRREAELHRQEYMGKKKHDADLLRNKRELEKKDKEIENLKGQLEDKPSDDYGRPKNGIVPGRYRGTDTIRVFDKELFTDMDVKKANEAIPMFTKATISFVVDETEEVIARDVLIGIKAYIHKAPAIELVNDVYNCIINKRKFLRFVKFVTGEERSLADLLFGFKELKADAMDARSGAGEWRSAFKRRRRWAKMSIPYLMKEYTPNGTLVMTMNEVNFIKDQYGIDIMTPDHVRMIMDADFLLGFVIIDQADEMVYVTYDGHGYGFQQYTYAMLERENQRTDRDMRELYRTIAGSR